MRVYLFFVFTTLLAAADWSSYRGFRFGSSLEAAAATAATKSSEARLTHTRPARIEELDWRIPITNQPSARDADTVREGLLRFYDGELFQIVSTYDPEHIEGMTDSDMIEAISKSYGVATQPRVEIPYHSIYSESAKVLARWENADCSYDLIRTGNQMGFAMVLSSKRADRLAQRAIAESSRLDILEAPAKAVALEKKIAADTLSSLEKARITNKPKFKP